MFLRFITALFFTLFVFVAPATCFQWDIEQSNSPKSAKDLLQSKKQQQKSSFQKFTRKNETPAPLEKTNQDKKTDLISQVDTPEAKDTLEPQQPIQFKPETLDQKDLQIKQDDIEPEALIQPTDEIHHDEIEVIDEPEGKEILINFTDINAVEFIRFFSRVSGKNFFFQESDLQFNISIVSEEPTGIKNVMTALLQELRIHDFELIEQGNNIIIHKNPLVRGMPQIELGSEKSTAAIVTRVIRLNTLDPEHALEVIQPLISQKGIIEVIKETGHVVVTDLSQNVDKVQQLLSGLDSPKSGLVLGQYVARHALVDSLIADVTKILLPIAQNQKVQFVPHQPSNSIFIVSTPYLIQRAIAILQRLDQFQGVTGVYDIDQEALVPGEEAGKETDYEFEKGVTRLGRWHLDRRGRWIFTPYIPPGAIIDPNQPPKGTWKIDENGQWYYESEGESGPALQNAPDGRIPKGQWLKTPDGQWLYQIEEDETISPSRIERLGKQVAGLPPGHILRTQFFIYKLKYREGDQIVDALQKIADVLISNERENKDLIAAIQSSQWIESSNSLIFIGTIDALVRMRELIDEIDTPLRQVFIEMLVLDTSMVDSLNYGVNFGSRMGGNDADLATSQAFLSSTASTLPNALDIAGIGQGADASSLSRQNGYNLGIIGRMITHNGQCFNSIAALVSALHDQTDSNIILNPKIIAEDNSEAEIFVGINTSFQTESIVNDLGSIVSTNFEFRDIGTTLKVTPQISENNMITLIIEQEISSILPVPTVVPTQVSGGGVLPSNPTNPGPTTKKSKTVTRVHVPNKYFVILSGMIQDEKTRSRDQVPCLGGIPVLGGAFSHKTYRDEKRNLMVFIRPQIVDTEEEFQNVTKHQQDIWKTKNMKKKMWKFETEEALDLLNLKWICTDDCCEDECDPP